MVNTIKVKPNRNLFLLYTLLNLYGLVDDSIDSHFLRRKTYEHFKKYKLKEIWKEDIDYSKFAKYVLRFEGKIKEDKNEKESVIVPYLKKLEEETDFDEYYRKEILPVYKEICEFLQRIVNSSNIQETIKKSYGVSTKSEMIVIPMPLEGRGSGLGPSLKEKSYQIIGPPYYYGIIHLLSHEASHPLAKKTLEPFKESIEKISQIYDLLKRNKKFPKSQYNNWNIAFEEHLIKAVNIARVFPEIIPKIDPYVKKVEPEEYLKMERERGFIFIDTFYKIIKENENKKMKDIIPIITKALPN